LLPSVQPVCLHQYFIDKYNVSIKLESEPCCHRFSLFVYINIL